MELALGWFDSDEERGPFEMFAGSGRPTSRKELIEQLEVSDLIRLHQDPVGKGDDYWSRQPDTPAVGPSR